MPSHFSRMEGLADLAEEPIGRSEFLLNTVECPITSFTKPVQKCPRLIIALGAPVCGMLVHLLELSNRVGEATISRKYPCADIKIMFYELANGDLVLLARDSLSDPVCVELVSSFHEHINVTKVVVLGLFPVHKFISSVDTQPGRTDKESQLCGKVFRVSVNSSDDLATSLPSPNILEGLSASVLLRAHMSDTTATVYSSVHCKAYERESLQAFIPIVASLTCTNVSDLMDAFTSLSTKESSMDYPLAA